MKYYYNLKMPPDANDPKQRPQYYFANNIIGLVWTMFKHRVWHLKHDGVWKD